MDVLRREVNRFLLKSVEDLLTTETVISGLSSSHSYTPTEKEYRGRKGHIPSVTTVPRADTLASGDRQARRRLTAVREGQTEKTIVADAGLFHRTPYNVEDTRLDNRLTPVNGRDSVADSRPREEARSKAVAPNTAETAGTSPTAAIHKGTSPNMVQSRGSTQDVTICDPTVTVKSDKRRKQGAPPLHDQYPATAVLCHKCGRRYPPDVHGYLRHHPRFCRGRRY